MSLLNKNAPTTKKSTPGDASGDARKVFAALLVAARNISLYPPGHVMAAKSAAKAYQSLSSYLESYGYLRIEIEKDRVLAQGEEILEGPFEEGSLPFILFRDGIRWLEFIEGLESEEVTEFFRVFHQFSVLADEPEGDFATGIWEVRFPHIQYEVADLYGGAKGEGAGSGGGDKKNKISSFKQGATTVPLREENIDERQSTSEAPIDLAETILTLQERKQLQEMIRREEQTDYSAGVDVLMDSMLLCRDKESFAAVVDILLEEFKNSLSRGEFDIAFKIAWGLRKVSTKYQSKMQWAEPVCSDFFAAASAPESLSPVLNQWNRLDDDQALSIVRLFGCLAPSALLTLALLPQGEHSPEKNRILADAITSLAAKDSRPLEALLGEAGQELADSLFPVVMELDAETSLRLLRRLARHSSASVRRRAVGEILRHPLASPDVIFKLIDDPDVTIRHLVLRYSGSFGRVASIEELLLSYLRNTKFTENDERHMIECFRALGRCGSSRSIPWLRETLLGRRWLPGKKRAARRKGAQIALEELEIPQARSVLEEAETLSYLPFGRFFRWFRKNKLTSRKVDGND